MRPLPVALLALALCVPAAPPAQAFNGQDLSGVDLGALEGFDPSALVGDVQDVLARTPDGQVDGLFQALHASMQRPDEAEAICGLFDDGADRGIDGLNATAMRLGEDSRQRFADAVAGVVVAGLQGQPQAWDPGAAAQALKANGARAAMLHDGFAAGFADGAPQQARCRSLGQMLDVLADRPLGERALVTRLLLDQGLRQVRL